VNAILSCVALALKRDAAQSKPQPQQLILAAEKPAPTAQPATGVGRATSRRLFSLPSVSFTSRTAVSRVAPTSAARSILGLR